MMKLPKPFFSFVFLFAILVGQSISGVRAFSRLKMRSEKVTEDTFQKLFVFGDSYVDIGNREYTAASWKTPYGITTGDPNGRYSDGNLLTDYVAKYFGLRTPRAYRFVNPYIPEMLQDGVNFAYGGVFDTDIPNPDVIVQISYLKKYVEEGYYNSSDLNKSLSVISVTSYDYAAYIRGGGTPENSTSFTSSWIYQIVEGIRSLYKLGVRKIAVTAMPPLGCSPYSAISPTECNDNDNFVASVHNTLLNCAVSLLNFGCGNCSVILDLYSAFEDAYGDFLTPYKACCAGISSNYTCGRVDEQGQALYTVCGDPNSSFYWDLVNPTQAAWDAMYERVLRDAFGPINHSLEQ